MQLIKSVPWGPVAILLAVSAIYVVFQPSALSPFGIQTILNNGAALAIASMGLTVVILTGGFDLSGLGVVALTNCLLATHPIAGLGGALISVLMAAGVGAAIGAINGFLIAVVGTQSIAATLGTMIMGSGLALLVLPAPGGEVADSIAYGLTGSVWQIPTAGMVLCGVLAVWGYLRRIRFGFSVYAVGDDPNSAANAGVRVRTTLFYTYLLAGLAYGLAGVMLSAQTASGDPNLSPRFLLLAFASVAIGGTRFGGGQGGIMGTLLAAITLTILTKMLFAVGVSSFLTGFFEGLVMIIAAVAISGTTDYRRILQRLHTG